MDTFMYNDSYTATTSHNMFITIYISYLYKTTT